ncbi:T9SS type B sorting domain-containing protein [Hymenobacter metallilatus]|uniref:Gliding motility-associated C-terminal domain-containing protein n=1 Tax=Hymenobacter metallilatus TaxID=2493666 RepID=A0A3R9NJK7_9BACT|nr:gliding motility-associated C-terminal domain-containing protein [Hymenobacter metallilatus]RSK29762.1 gliding motility-associated C-terminal domain-containing protein [Hymenobacter metallilatus]
MRTPLLRTCLLLLIILLAGARPAAATHLLGGEMNYKYLDANGPSSAPFRYQVTVLVYLNKEAGSAAPDGRPTVDIVFYNKSQGGTRILNVTVPRTSFAEITPPSPGGCTLPNSQPPRVTLAKYVTIVNLPLSFDGYYAVYTDTARNVDVTNLSNPGGTNMTLYTDMAPPLLPNTSPVFSDTAVAVICQGDTSIIINNAYDADGDRLIYSFGTPYQGQAPFGAFTPPPPLVNYASGYSVTRPFGQGTGSYAALNASTGLSYYAAPIQGKFVVAVDVKEYRTINGREVLVGTTRRDIQLVSRPCQPNQAPVFTPPSVVVKDYTVEEGRSINFSVTSTDPEGQSLTMKVNSALLDGTGPFDFSINGNQGTVPAGSPTGSANVTATGSVTGNFVFNTRCGNARATPYDVVVTVSDNTCGSKSISEVFRITVTRAAGPNRILGDTIVCDRTQALTYTAAGPTASSYQWKVQGGTIQGSATTSTVRVVWGAAGTGRLSLRGVSSLGCPTDSVARTVDVRNAAVLTVSPNVSICPGASTTLTAGGGQNYAWTSSSGQTFTGASITVAPAQTTTYTVLTTDGTCTSSKQVTVTVNPAAVANAGPAQTTCSGVPVTLGSAALTGYTYQWAPATGLSSAATAQPVFTLTNTTTAAQTYSYTLTATTAQGCVATSTVTVTVNPAAIANAGTDRAVCSNTALTLGTSALTGYTYQWSPATGLSSSTAAQPVLTLSNTGSGPQIFNYVVTATTAQGCVSRDTVRVTINPTAVANAGSNRAVCSAESTVLGAAALTGYTYQWAPATGLSSSTAAQPTFSQVNTGTTPQTYTYTLTATTAQGCTSTSTVTITVNPASVANAGPDAALCDKKQVTIGTTALAGYTYQWSPATNLSSATTARPVFTARNATQSPITLTYVVTATTGLGCASRDTVRLTVNPRPLPDSIQGSVSVCPTVQGVTYSIRNPRNTAYQWQVAGGTITSGQGTPSITVNWGGATAAASVKAFQLNSFGCSSDTVTLPVRVNQLLSTPRPTGPLQVCQNAGPFTYQTQYTNGSVYAWQIIGGTQVSTNQASVQVNWTRTGLVKLVVTESSNPAGGICRGTSDTLYVNVLPAPAANLAISGPARVCAGSGNVVFSLPGAAGSSYAFTLNGATVAGTGNTLTVPVPAASATPYTVTIRETNASGCVGQPYTKTFLVVPPLAVTGPPSYCPEARTGLSYSASALAGGQYQWTITGGTITAGQGTGTVTVDIPAGSATATLSVTETTSQSCAATFTIRPDNAAVQLNTASVEAAAQDRSITLALQVPGNSGNGNRVQILRRDAGSTGAYTTVGTVANSATAFTDTGVEADRKAYQYQLNLTNACGTVLSSQTHTTILTTATATQSTGGRNVGQVQVSWSAYQGFAVKEYRVSRVADNGAAELVGTVAGSVLRLELPTSTAGFAQCFRVQAVSTDATPRTSASNDACVTFENKLDFYNIITPNGDGKNDVLVIDNVALYPRNTLTIFSRWGKQVYQTRNYRNDYGGQEQAQGMYYYLFQLEDGTSYKGWFEIVR